MGWHLCWSISRADGRGVDERFPGELDTLRADDMRQRWLLKLSEEQARAAVPDQPALTGAPPAPVDIRSAPEAKVWFYASLFRCRTDVHALRWENRRDGRSGWMPAINGYRRNGMSRAGTPYLTLPRESDWLTTTSRRLAAQQFTHRLLCSPRIHGRFTARSAFTGEVTCMSGW